MDLPRLKALSEHWEERPPVHVSVAAYVGWGKSKADAASDAEFEALMNSLPAVDIKPS